MFQKIFQWLFLSPVDRRYDAAYTKAKRIVKEQS